jgi:nucleotide-binding universal stress UspA family protein
MIPTNIPEIERILYSTDLSQNARFAFAYAASLANRFGAGITILHVIEDTSRYRHSLVVNVLGEEKWSDLVKQNEERLLQTLKERLKNFCSEVAEQLPACPFITDDIIVKIGNPVDEILKEADANNSDLVVMGAHGQGFIAGAVMGSTSRRVLRRCKKPVLVVRLPEED